MKISFVRRLYDNYVYYKMLDDKNYIYLLLHVDDMLLANSATDERVEDLLKAEFDMKDLGPTKQILGIEITRARDKRILFLSQQRYAKKVLGRLGMVDSKLVSTPFA